MTGLEAAAGLVIAWVVSKARRVGKRADTEVDQVLDASMDRLHELVAAKLGTGMITALQAEAGRTGQVSDQMRERMLTALREAAGADSAFAERMQTLVVQVQTLQEHARSGHADGVLGDHGTVVAGNVDIRADDGSAAAWNIGSVSFGGEQPGPSLPGQPID